MGAVRHCGHCGSPDIESAPYYVHCLQCAQDTDTTGRPLPVRETFDVPAGDRRNRDG